MASSCFEFDRMRITTVSGLAKLRCWRRRHMRRQRWRTPPCRPARRPSCGGRLYRAAGAFIMRRAPSSCGGRFHAGLHAGCAQLPHSSCRLQADQPLLLCSKMPARLRLLSPRARASFSLPYLLPLAAARSCGRSPAPPDRAPQAPWCGRPPHAAFRCGTADGGGGVFSSARGL